MEYMKNGYSGRDHKKHGTHPHDKVAAMPQFNKPHWEKKLEDTYTCDQAYASEFNSEKELRDSVDGLAHYVKKHGNKNAYKI